MPPRETRALAHADGLSRCPWPGTDPLYLAYHDGEWGRPERDGRALFEKLILDGFQAGLSWITILRKREAFRAAFDGFDPGEIARYTDAKRARLMEDAGIVRNRAKIEAATQSARAWMKIEEREGFANYLWKYVDGAALQNRPRDMKAVPAATPLSERVSKDLRAEGFNFVGPTIVYAFMQAVGIVNDHLADCHVCEACARLGSRP
ncbi:MAG: DNA-3-methyladenine glycosylase I [Hyphomicrobiales bacterium]|nr:DNA-3-methyladenine glycosylase I [Hyphomicrobiales bacterium]MDE2016158.1 DNA-3-methyladenine glycosylase I [Hyphomicrobiales bacterium]